MCRHEPLGGIGTHRDALTSRDPPLRETTRTRREGEVSPRSSARGFVGGCSLLLVFWCVDGVVGRQAELESSYPRGTHPSTWFRTETECSLTFHLPFFFVPSQIPIAHVHHHRRKKAKSLSLVSCPSTIPSCHRFRDHCQPFPLSPLPHLLELPPHQSPRLPSRPSKASPRQRESRTLSLMVAILHQTKASLILCLPTLPQPHNRPHPLDPRH